jgi:serine protease inhibitor
MKDKLNEALNEVHEEYIAQAAAYRRKRRPYWLGAVAAALAVVLVAGILGPGAQAPAPSAPMLDAPTFPEPTRPASPAPIVTTAPSEDPEITVPAPTIALLSGEVAAPRYPAMAQFPFDGGNKAYKAWRQSQLAQYDQPHGYADNLTDFFKTSIRTALADNGKNTAYSPLNVYMALAMLAETAGGSSRQEVLNALSTENIEALRTQAGHVWNAHYCADGATTSLLANSLWLDSVMADYRPETVQLLADTFYASVFHHDLGTEDANNALAAWLDRQTDGMLREQLLHTELDPDTVFALASTVYYRVKWKDTFFEGRNTEAAFHAPDGDEIVTYMNRTVTTPPYFAGGNYALTALHLEDGGKMWLILPAEGTTPGQLLAEGEWLDMVLGRKVSAQDLRVNLSLPKFDISSQTDLSQTLQTLGVTSVINSSTADFSPLIHQTHFDGSVRLSKIDHAARVQIDEEGIAAAAYTIMQAPGESIPPEQEVDLVLDRPFLFLITSRDGLPLFAGVVNDP